MDDFRLKICGRASNRNGRDGARPSKRHCRLHPGVAGTRPNRVTRTRNVSVPAFRLSSFISGNPCLPCSSVAAFLRGASPSSSLSFSENLCPLCNLWMFSFLVSVRCAGLACPGVASREAGKAPPTRGHCRFMIYDFRFVEFHLQEKRPEAASTFVPLPQIGILQSEIGNRFSDATPRAVLAAGRAGAPPPAGRLPMC